MTSKSVQWNMVLLLLPPTRKKVAFEFFAFRINSFWEKALDIQTLIGKFGLNNFPDFEVP